MEGFRLHVRFLDDLEGVVDLSAYVHAPDAGVFAPLQDPSLFGQAYLDGGVVTWPGGLDLAPDAMHSEILRHGEWKVA